jgi:Zn-dependent protease
VQISLPNPATRRMDDILITLAGPAMNLVLCLVFVLVGLALGVSSDDPTSRNLGRFLVSGMLMNIGLFCFNLIPIPPLDGSRIFYRLGLYSLELFTTLSQYGFIILIILINLPGFSGVLGYLQLLILSPFLWVWPGDPQEFWNFLMVGR